MKKFLLVALAVTTLAAGVPGAAFAQGGPHGPGSHGNNDRGGPDRGRDRDDHRRGNQGRNDHRPPGNAWGHGRHDDGRREWHGQRYAVERYAPPPRYAERHWRRGERLPTYYRGEQYRVDYRRYNLAPPPRGYEYVRVNNDVVLAAVATGVISSIIIGLMYQ